MRNKYTYQRFKTLFLTIGFIILLAGPECVFAQLGVTVTTNADTYKLRDDIVITIKNTSNEPVHYNGLCSLNLCEEHQGEWMCEFLDCEAPEEVLSSGGEKEYRIKVLGLLAGYLKYKLDYRTAVLEHEGTVYSNTFFVQNMRKGGLFGGVKNSTPSKKVKKEVMINRPAAKKEVNPKIIDILENGERKTSRYVPKRNKYEVAPAQQRLTSKHRKKKAEKIALKGSLSESKIILSVSGVDENERGVLAEVLARYFDSIEQVEQIYYHKGNIQYFLELNIDPVTFSEELEAADLATFRLDVMQVSPGQIDCVLRSRW